MAQHGHLTDKEKKQIRQDRKKLRKELKELGIKGRRDFEDTAQMMGLVYGDNPPFMWWFYRGIDKIMEWSLWKWLLLLMVVIFLGFIYASIANEKGNFSITVDYDLAQLGLALYEDLETGESKVRLRSSDLMEVNPYSIQDLPEDMDTSENGCHSIDDVVIYTFYLQNDGTTALSSDWFFVLNEATNNVDKSSWVMIYDEGRQTLYTKPRDDGSDEYIVGIREPNLIDQSAVQEDQYIYDEETDTYEIHPYMYMSENVVAAGEVRDLQPGESRRYTVAIWVEGEDFDCDETLLGGHAGFSMKFAEVGDEEGSNVVYGHKRDDASIGIEEEDYNILTSFVSFFKNLFSKTK